jgi:hypothetical protein
MEKTNQTEEQQSLRRQVEASFNWLPISANSAWSLCEKENKSAPYAGYTVKLATCYVRCARTASGHIYDVAYI